MELGRILVVLFAKPADPKSQKHITGRKRSSGMPRSRSKPSIQPGAYGDFLSPLWASVCPSVKWGCNDNPPTHTPQDDALPSTKEKALARCRALCPPEEPRHLQPSPPPPFLCPPPPPPVHRAGIEEAIPRAQSRWGLNSRQTGAHFPSSLSQTKLGAGQAAPLLA